MTQTKKYAIRCSSEEEARECNQQKYNYYYKGIYTRFLCNEYNIPSISYEEAVEIGLLGKYDTHKISDEKYDTNTLSEMVEPSKNKLIEKIVDELYEHFDIKFNLTARDEQQLPIVEIANKFLIEVKKKDIRDILTKHLSLSKQYESDEI